MSNLAFLENGLECPKTWDIDPHCDLITHRETGLIFLIDFDGRKACSHRLHESDFAAYCLADLMPEPELDLLCQEAIAAFLEAVRDDFDVVHFPYAVERQT